FVSGTDRETDRDDEKRLPAFENIEANKKFTRDHCRHESLREMAEPVVVIPVPVKIIAKPVKDRLVRVSPMPTDSQDRDVNRYERVNEGGELKPAIRRSENNQADDPRENFQPPGQPIVRINTGPDEDDGDADQKRDVRFFHFGLCEAA